jgi:thioredoxin-related protein
LNFCNSVLNQTQKDLEVLLRFKNDYKGDLEIINVGLYDDFEQMKKLSQRFGDKMEFWYVENPDEIKRIYNIKSIPSFFLIDKDGNFLMTRGAEPNDELRMLLQRIFKM